MNPNISFESLKKPVKRGPKPRRPIRRRTRQRANDEARYRRRVKVWLVGKRCEACIARFPEMRYGWQAEENHHRNGRVGKLLNYEPFWIPVCHNCHIWIHFQNPEKAQEIGLLGNAGEWNNQSLVPK